jgi:hypothetical protein
MSFEFTESVGVYLPKFNENQSGFFAESENNQLIVEIAAIHAGLTANYNNYPEEELKASLKSWVDPYPKPIILNHDPESDSMGRVMAARMDKEKDGTPFSRLQVAVLNREAIEKVLDGRYMTGSVGGKAESAKCSICNVDWAKPTEGMGMPCKHKRGQVYNGKLAFFNLSGLSWKEYSFVNIPADQGSGVLSRAEDNPEWIRSTKVFALNMSEETILELSESETPKNILLDLKKKEAHVTYMNVKGTFLTTSAYDYQESYKTNITFENMDTTIDNEISTQELIEKQEELVPEKENEMSAKEETEDILSVAEKLSADLSSEESNSSEETSETDLTVETSEELSESSDTKTDPAETEVEAKEDEKQESDDSKVEEKQLSEKVEESTEEQAKSEESAEKLEVKEEEEVSEKDTLIASLTEENAKLKKTLHFMLAERVVDTKISLGVLESSDRAEALKDHSERTAASLADAIRDLGKISTSKSLTFSKESVAKIMDQKALAVEENDEKVIEEGQRVTKKEQDPATRFEDILVNKLLNRKNS